METLEQRARKWRREWLAYDIIPVVDWDESDEEAEEDARITMLLGYLDDKLAAFCRFELLAAAKEMCEFCAEDRPFVNTKQGARHHRIGTSGYWPCEAAALRRRMGPVQEEEGNGK